LYDLLFKNAVIIDGTGAPERRGNVAVSNGRIVLAPGEAVETVDAGGKVLCPGFIDSHSHGDRILGTDYGRLCKTSQGITTEVVGQCGSTCFPVAPGKADLLVKYLGALPPSILNSIDGFTSFANYLNFVNAQQLTANCLMLTGHTALRLAVMGYDRRKPTDRELQKMRELLRECMEHGSLGLSTGLLYSPSRYADVDEVAALCEVVAEYGGLYTTHMRDESSHVVESVRESLEVVRRTGVRLCISHHKICGRQNWGLSEQTLALIDEAVNDGFAVNYDVYPYTASMSKLSVCLPAYCFAGGTDALNKMLQDPQQQALIKAQMTGDDPEFDGRYRHCGGFTGILISQAPETPEAEGMTIAEYAQKTGRDEFETYFDLVVKNGAKGYGIYYSMCDEDLERIVAGPHGVIGSDGVVTSMHGKTHPRGWGTFPRAIRLFVKEKHLFDLPGMIRRMTSLTAEKLGLKDRGRIAEGLAADLLLLDFDKIGDTATYTDPAQLCEGIECVVTNGKIVYRDKKLTGTNSGRFIPRP